MLRAWDFQVCFGWPLQLGLHVDHTDPSITLHLPCVIVAFGRLKQPGFRRPIRSTPALGPLTPASVQGEEEA